MMQQQQHQHQQHQQPEETTPNNSSSRTMTFEWPTVATSYELLGKIGQGAFATVWKARTIVMKQQQQQQHESLNHAEQQQTASAEMNEQKQPQQQQQYQQHECAIKVLNLDHVDSDLQEIRLEVQAMRLSSHPNVLQCCTAFLSDVHLWLVTPLMRKGSSLYCLTSIRKRIRKQYKQQAQQQQSQETPLLLSQPQVSMEDFILYIIRESLLGLQYIHDNGQIHRDIKAGNILLDNSSSNSNTHGYGCYPSVKIADFGVSGWLVHAGSQQEKAKTFVGTPCWMAPEVMEQVHGYDYKADIWSLGITALELAKGYAPYAHYPPMKVLILTIQEDAPTLDTYEDDQVEQQDYYGGGSGDLQDNDTTGDAQQQHPAPAPEEYSKSFRALVDLCLQKSPNRRPTCQELLQGKYLSSLNDETVLATRRQAISEMLNLYVPDVGSHLKTPSPTQQQQQQQQPSSSLDHAAADAPPIDSNDAMTQRRAAAGTAAPGHSPVSIILSTEKDRPPGTTWVFADGSQVFRSGSGTTSGNNNEDYDGSNDIDDDVEAAVNDVLAELDEFGKQTGGEHYYGESTMTTSTSRTAATAALDATAAAIATSDSVSADHDGAAAQELQHQRQQQQLLQEQEEQQQQQQQQLQEAQEQADDLNDFMDEFEMHTAGEDFRHPSK